MKISIIQQVNGVQVEGRILASLIGLFLLFLAFHLKLFHWILPLVGAIVLVLFFLGFYFDFFSLLSLIISDVTLVLLVLFAGFVWKGVVLIRDNHVGILTRKMLGNKMPEGQIIAHTGEIGIQAQTMMPGLYWRNPVIWKVEKVTMTDIGPDEIGVVESVDGQPISPGRLLGDEIPCNSYQDAPVFLANGGRKGPQVGILRPGTYRINTKVFSINKHPVISIPKEKVGIAVALDGTPLPPGYIIAPKPIEEKTDTYPKVLWHRFFQDGQAFIDSSGYRGPQLDTLQPGKYYINPLLFKVELYDVAEVPPGYVAVLRSNIGAELEKGGPIPSETAIPPDLAQPVHEEVETLLKADRNTRGIWKDPVAPGKYNLNFIAFTPYLVPTSAVTIDWAASSQVRGEHIVPPEVRPRLERKDDSGAKVIEAGETEKATEFFKFSQLRVTSKDGFQLDVDVRMIIRIRPEHAAFVIARFGSVPNLIEQIVHPLIDSSFRNKAGEKKAIEFVQSRYELQHEALEKAREEFKQYHVEAQNLLIAYIAVDQTLLKTQTDKEIALQQQEQYREQALAQEKRIEVEQKKAQADKQTDVISAKLSIQIAADRADALRRESEGIRDATKAKADGVAYEQREVGKGTADAYRAQNEVLGPELLALLKVLKEVADGKVKITPDVLVTGGDNQGGGLFNAWLATMLRPGSPLYGGKGEGGQSR